jgi:O-antigen biosynthesis protein
MVDERVLFKPTPELLARAIDSRRRLNHAEFSHKYFAAEARDRWLSMHEEAAPAPLLRLTALPDVSVCIPYYNHGRYLERLIEAFAGQDYPNFEVVMINDGSTGESHRIFERFFQSCQDHRFRFISSDNHGAAAARNTAVSMTKSDYLIFFDSDNLPKSADFIRRLVDAIGASNADCVTVPYDLVDEGCAEPSEHDIFASYRPMGECVELGFSENVFGDTPMIVKRPVFESIGGFPTDRESAEDHELLLKLSIRGFRIEVYPETLYFYRVSPRSRHRTTSEYRILENLFTRLAEAPPSTLLNIVKEVALPLIVASRQ